MTLFLFILLFSSSAFAQARVYTMDDLVHDCTICSKDEKSSECIYCNGLVTGVASTLGVLENGKSFCPTPDMDTKLARNMVRKWALDVNKDPDLPAVSGIIAAMQSTFYCKR